jgi:MSHA biogenesis protein MshO
MNRRNCRAGTAGFTLVEMVIAISIMGILAAIAGVYLTPAMNAYFATQRRAELTDVADTALRRMGRDTRLALPNSVRSTTSGTSQYVEILLTRNGGRYRASNDDDSPSVTTEDILDFTAADSSFDTLGNLDITGDRKVLANDYVVIHNLGITGANAYNTAATNPNIKQILTYTSGGGVLAGEDHIVLTAANLFPLESPGRRFFVVSGPVSFACTTGGGVLDGSGNGTGTLRRWSGYTIPLAQPTSLPGGATDALLANYVSACTILYTTLPLQSRGLVSVQVTLTRGNESVTLYQEFHVNNVP